MAIRTINLNELTSKAASVYEAVLVIAKRARAITAERKAHEALQETDYDTTEALELSEIIVEEEEKAIVIAMDDFFENRLEIKYRKQEEPVNVVLAEEAELMSNEKAKPKRAPRAPKAEKVEAE